MKKYTIEDYEITREGKIINKHNNKERKPFPNTKGYLRVQINKKNLFVHRLVAEKYIPNPNNLPQVNHKDGNKLNNNVDNLEWCTNQQNRDHAMLYGLHTIGDDCSWSKLNSDKVKFIRQHKEDITVTQFSQLFNVTRSTIKSVISNKSWKDVK